MQPEWFFTWNEILLIRSEALRSTLELFAGWPNRSALDMEEEPCKQVKSEEYKIQCCTNSTNHKVISK
jgi:hypothetical protein